MGTDARDESNTMSTSRLLLSLATLSLVAAACTGGEDGPTATEVSEPVEGEPFVTTPTETITRQPLTGRPIGDDADLPQRPALAVKVDNHPEARPSQAGLAVADLVYEEIVEDDQTRFIAVFHGTGSSPVGPIRSSRSQDLPLLEPLGLPLFASSGANPGVTALVAEAPVVDLSEQQGAGGYFRGPQDSPFNLFNDTETLWAQAPANSGPPTEQFAYLAPGESFEGLESSGFGLTLGEVRVEWGWDFQAEMWVRAQNGTAHVDSAHGSIMANNVIVLSVAYGRSAIDVNSPEARTVGEGLVLVFSDGRVVEGRWSRPTSDSPFTMVDQNDVVIALTPGNTWVELAAADPTNPVVPVDFFAVF